MTGTVFAMLLAVSVLSAPKGDLYDEDMVVTNVDTTGIVLLNRDTRTIEEIGNTNRVNLGVECELDPGVSITNRDLFVKGEKFDRSFGVTNGVTEVILKSGIVPRLTATVSETGAQTYVTSTNGTFLWVKDDTELQFGGARNADGSVTGTSTVGSRVLRAVNDATRGMVTLQSSDWAAVTNRIANMSTEEITMFEDGASRLSWYSIAADGTVRKKVMAVEDVEYHSTSQGFVSVEIPMYVYCNGPAYVNGSASSYNDSWVGPYYKKVPGEMRWTYDETKTSADFKGYRNGSENYTVRNYYFNAGTMYLNYFKDHSFSYNRSSSTSLCAVYSKYSEYWQGHNYAKNTLMPLGGSVDFVSAIQGSDSAQYLGFGSFMKPNVQGDYQNTRWYFDRSIGSGDYISVQAQIPYSWTVTETNLVEDSVLHIVTAPEDIRFVKTEDGLAYVTEEFVGADSPWHLEISYGDDTRVTSVDLPYRGKDEAGNMIWSYHESSSQWTGNPVTEWGTIIWNVLDKAWVVTGGLSPWYIPAGGAVSGIYYMNFLADRCSPNPAGYVNYPSSDLGFVGTLEVSANMDGDPSFFGRYSRTVAIGPRAVTNAVGGASSCVPRTVVTNDVTYTAVPRMINGSIIMVYEEVH